MMIELRVIQNLSIEGSLPDFDYDLGVLSMQY